MRDDLNRVAAGARQHAVLRDPDLLIALLAYQLSHDLHWQKPFGLSTEDVPNWPTTAAEGYALDDRLTNGTRPTCMAKTWPNPSAPSARRARITFAASWPGSLRPNIAAVPTNCAHWSTRTPNPRSASLDPHGSEFLQPCRRPLPQRVVARSAGPERRAPDRHHLRQAEKGEKAEKLEKLFADPSTRKAHGLTEAQEARIAAWVPEGME
ncbi:hypothetical protein [Paracoccus tegillarcae]|uniref:hypothetical protein n=1 Tax=Paracoccus tegillarcae TaxID=1529068 RepID=UPI001300B29C|nr:hypothetical protein [Paracoccus tegillarcae]